MRTRFKWEDKIRCPACQSTVHFEWKNPKRRWTHTVSAVIVILIVLLHFAIVPVNAAQLFVVDNYACGTSQDWRNSGLSYGESIAIKDVKLAYGESTEGDREVSFTVSNKKSTRLPVHIHWVVRAEMDGNLVVVGAASSDFELNLMKPGDNRFNTVLHPILSSDSKEFYGCLALGYEE